MTAIGCLRRLPAYPANMVELINCMKEGTVFYTTDAEPWYINIVMTNYDRNKIAINLHENLYRYR